MKVGDRVRSTRQYSICLSTQEAFYGVIKKVSGDLITVCSDNRGRVQVSKAWLELDEPCCRQCCKCCCPEPVEVYEYLILSVRPNGKHILSSDRYGSVKSYLDAMGENVCHTGHELFIPSKKLKV